MLMSYQIYYQQNDLLQIGKTNYMKYRINNSYEDQSFDIITEDGGIASVYHNGDNTVTNYYQSRLTDIDINNYLWDELSSSKVYCKDWDTAPSTDEVIKDALDWLVCPSPQYWELDNTIFEDVFNNNI